MGFYDNIAQGINYEITSNEDAYLKVVNGKLLLPNPGWLRYHLRYLDNVIESIKAFAQGLLAVETIDIDQFEKKVIVDPIEGIKFLRFLSVKYKVFSVDIETDNTLPDAKRNRLLCIGVGYELFKGVAFRRECFEHKLFRALFQTFVKRKDFTFVLQNGIFDLSRLKIIEGIELKLDEDTLLMHYCGINEHKGTHGLKQMAQLYLGFPEWEKPLDEWKHQYCRTNKIKLKDFQYGFFDQNWLAEYCCIDCCATLQLLYKFRQLMRPESLSIYRKLIVASKYYARMIERGMLLNMDYWEELRCKLEYERLDLEDELEVLIPDVKITSPVQLKAWLQAAFPYDYIETTDKDTMENLLLKYPDDVRLQKILAYRKNLKYLKTYVYGLWERKDTENVIHCEFKLHGTETGRLSSANPNMQNIPRNSDIKRLFKAREGYKYIQLDYSQAELRVLAYVSQDDHLKECYREGKDLHLEIQKRLFKDKFDEHNKDQRTIAKTINFGIPYGRTAGGMSRKLRISMPEARGFLKLWFEANPKVKDYIAKCHAMSMSDPQDVWVTAFGRSRHYFVTADSVHHVQNQAVNFPISSTANDLTIHSLVEIGQWLEEQKLDAYLINTVHDSIVIEARPKDIQRISEKCQEIMASIPQKYLTGLDIPFRADVEVGDNYGDLSEPDWYEDDDEEES